MDVSETLPAVLEKRGWTQERLADATGIPRTDINAMCKGRLRPGPKRLPLIAQALEVSVLELGAPSDQADERGLELLDHLGELRTGLAAVMATQGEVEAVLEQLQARVALLEADPKRSRKGG